MHLWYLFVLNVLTPKPICTASLTFNNSTFCPHSVFMCFVLISEQTEIISLYNIKWLVCINQAEGVYCAVQTEFSNIIPVNMCLKGSVLQSIWWTLQKVYKFMSTQYCDVSPLAISISTNSDCSNLVDMIPGCPITNILFVSVIF